LPEWRAISRRRSNVHGSTARAARDRAHWGQHKPATANAIASRHEANGRGAGAHHVSAHEAEAEIARAIYRKYGELMKAALYARYSTDKQSGASIEDQLRICERIAERHGFSVLTKFSDAAISGGTTQRPGYQAMLDAARLRQFDVIVAEDTSRLWRNLAEQAPRLAELSDLGVNVITHDLDTRQESAGMLSAVLGASSESYRKEIGRRVRRGLEGLARRKKPTGGRAYGYETVDGQRVTVPERAEIVREVFRRFANGDTLLAIASDLNARGIPSPGSEWKRTQKTADGKWRVSALHSLLQNDIYSGRVVWNRCRWIRSASDSSKRRYVENPQSEWIIHDEPKLRLVDQELFEQVQRRFAERSKLFKPGQGGKHKYLLSGLLRCECGGAYIVTAHNPVRYACATHKQAGPAACANRLQLAADRAETEVLEKIRRHLLSAEAEEHAVKTLKAMARDDAEAPAPETAKLDAQIAELERLRASGVLSADIAGAALQKAYKERDAGSRKSKRKAEPLKDAVEAYRATVREMRKVLEAGDIPAARDALLLMLDGPLQLRPKGDRLLASRLAVAPKNGMVAGVRSGTLQIVFNLAA
jgi:DNA invertase Pin-like site-specific DNA recombinase